VLPDLLVQSGRRGSEKVAQALFLLLLPFAQPFHRCSSSFSLSAGARVPCWSCRLLPCSEQDGVLALADGVLLDPVEEGPGLSLIEKPLGQLLQLLLLRPAAEDFLRPGPLLAALLVPA